jgi:hypothetical protein
MDPKTLKPVEFDHKHHEELVRLARIDKAKAEEEKLKAIAASPYKKVFKWKEDEHQEFEVTCTTEEDAKAVINYMLLRERWKKENAVPLAKIDADYKEAKAKKREEVLAYADEANMLPRQLEALQAEKMKQETLRRMGVRPPPVEEKKAEVVPGLGLEPAKA